MALLTTQDVRLDVNQAGGMLDHVAITWQDRTIEPLYRAPWVDVPGELEPTAPVHLRGLAGDFFCAPFGKSDDEAEVPTHGWAANGFWSVEKHLSHADFASLLLALDHTINGASLRKEITLRKGHPVVYQRHIFSGGTGSVPIAHHPMIHAPGGLRLSFSPKDFGATPAQPLHEDPAIGRSILSYPQRFRWLADVVLADGTHRDLRIYPFAEGHEDFLTLFDPPDARIGWSAALANSDGFVFFAVKDARILCQTSLWLSNAGRYDPPYCSRLVTVLGLEESSAHFVDGNRASVEANAFSSAGYRTALPLLEEEDTIVRYAFGAVAIDKTWTEVVSIEVGRDTLTISDISGAVIHVPFDGGFFYDDKNGMTRSVSPFAQ